MSVKNHKRSSSCDWDDEELKGDQGSPERVPSERGRVGIVAQRSGASNSSAMLGKYLATHLTSSFPSA